MPSIRKNQLPILLQGLENSILQRQSRIFLSRVRELSPYLHQDADIYFKICDGFRRIGMYARGFQWLKIYERPRNLIHIDTFEGKKLLWAARFLNLMGATEFAIDLIQYLNLSGNSASVFEAHRIKGNIYLAHFDFQRAHLHFEKWLKKFPIPVTYTDRLTHISVADVLAGLGRNNEAKSLVRQLLLNLSKDEVLLYAIALGSLGEYEVNSRNWKRGLELLNQSKSLFSVTDYSPDRAFIEKWSAVAWSELGDKKTATLCFRNAFEWLKNTGIRPEAWLDVVRLEISSKTLPASRSRILTQSLFTYPGLANGFKQRLTQPLPIDSASQKKYWIDLESDEYHLPQTTTPTLGIPLELKLLSYLILASPWWLTSIRAKSLLWPSEFYAFLHLEGRLLKLVKRLHVRYQYKIELNQGRISLVTDICDVQVVPFESLKMPSFLRDVAVQRTEKIFSMLEFSKHYGLSQTQALVWVQLFVKYNWISKVDNEGKRLTKNTKRGSRYRVN